jgi:hypothetical protein
MNFIELIIIIKELMEIITRMCCNTEYMFMYTLELLNKVDQKFGVEVQIEGYHRLNNGIDDSEVPVVVKQRRRFRRLRQEIEVRSVSYLIK